MLAQALPFIKLMNLNDFLIIYLACGAPFGVYYFFDNRTSPNVSFLFLKSFLIFLFWMPFALRMLLKNTKLFKNNFDRISQTDSDIFNKIFPVQKEIEKVLIKSDLKLSIYEFREVAERYIGLTIAKQNAECITTNENTESEIFKIAENENTKISSICFNRRNRKLLFFHQKNARQDFLDIISKILSASADKQSRNILLSQIVTAFSYKLVTLINDTKAQADISVMSGDLQQNDLNLNVINMENELWKTEKHKPLPANKISIRLPTLTAVASFRRKD